MKFFGWEFKEGEMKSRRINFRMKQRKRRKLEKLDFVRMFFNRDEKFDYKVFNRTKANDDGKFFRIDGNCMEK